MFERFTDDSRRVVVAAQEEAKRLGHGYIGNEHLLLGMLVSAEAEIARGGQPNSVGLDILISGGMTAQWAREEIVRHIGDTYGRANQQQHIPFTPLSKRVLQTSMQIAVRNNHPYIQVDHMLLALLEVEDSLAAALLAARLPQSEIDPSTQMSIDEFAATVIQGMSHGEPSSPAVTAGSADRDGRGGKEKTLAEFAEDLVAKATAGKLDPVIGRERETDRVIRILGRRTKNNPILIGDPGVGKTAIVEGLAQKIATGEVPSKLKGAKIYSLDLSGLVAGAKFRGDFEERLRRLLKEATENQNIILFIDEIHTLVGAGAAEGAIDASSILKPRLARGELRVIGATTHDEYVKHFEKDSALDRRFQPVDVDEPSVEDAKAIIRGVAPRFEEFHQVSYEPESLDAAVDLSVQYLSKRFLPDKAIDLIDEAASYVVSQKEDPTSTIIEVDDIIEVLEGWTGGKIRQAQGAEATKLNHLEDELGKRVIGQREGLAALSRAVRRARAGLKDPHRPAGSFIFLGPSGVGKTETAKSLAEFLYGSDENLITIDMSEYMEKHAVSRLLGAPPGYIGHDEGGQLTEAVRRKPFSVVLFDEIEKAHPDVFNTLLQLLEEGRLTDSQGRKVDFTNTVIIMTSNLGTETKKKTPVGFGSSDRARDEYDAMRDRMQDALKTHFRTEFLNRIDEVVVFEELDMEALEQIVDLRISEVSERLSGLGAELLVTQDARRWMADRGYNSTFGARPLRRVIQREVEDRLSEMILAGEIVPGSSVVVDRAAEETEGLTFSVFINAVEPEAAVSADGIADEVA